MQTVRTHLALGDLNGFIGVFSEFYSERKPLKNEGANDENAFIKYVNARNLPELLIALDSLYGQFEMLDFTADLLPGSHRPTGTNEASAETICKWFDNSNPTRTTIDKTREALDVWSISRAKPKYTPSTNGKPGDVLYLFTPLEDIIKASEDLRRAALLMAWLLGKTDFQTAHGLPQGDRKARMRLINDPEPKFLHDYYETLENNSGNTFFQFNTHMAIDQMHLYSPESIENAVQTYVAAAFSILMSDQRKVMDDNSLLTYNCSHTILSAAWSYLAEGLGREEGSGAICVCEHCHRFFEQHRKTRRFCSNSCRVMNLHKQSESKPAEATYETKVMRYRKEILDQKINS